jgi:hypothetical protein
MFVRPDVLAVMSNQNRPNRTQSVAGPLEVQQEPSSPTKEATFERNKRLRAAELQKKMITDNTVQTSRFERLIKQQ